MIFFSIFFITTFGNTAFVSATETASGKPIITKKSQTRQKTVDTAIATPADTEFLWQAFNKHKTSITVRFTCNEKGQINIAFTDPGQPNYVKGRQAVIRMVTANFPPSTRGYMKLIYTSTFEKDHKTLNIRKRDIKYFMQELNVLRLQTFKNKDITAKEYEEKIKYCSALPKSQRQKCYESSSGYQPTSPGIFIWIKAEETPPGSSRESLFDPSILENLKKLSCYNLSLK